MDDMRIGNPGAAESHICQAYEDRVEVRGRDLVLDLMGQVTFTEYFHLLLTGRHPTTEQRFFLDLLLVAIAEHGMMPTNIAARMTLAADPRSIHGAVAAGILGCGSVILGAVEDCAALLERLARQRTDVGAEIAAIRAARARVPGFGHPVHKPVDPRAGRILALADEHAITGTHVRLARAVDEAVAEAWGRPLVMNVSMAIAAVLLDLGFPAAMAKAIPILARTASLLAHIAEEQQQPVGFLMAEKAGAAVTYSPTTEPDD
jgi:citrate synthase